MIVLATENPKARIYGEHILLEVPSGSSDVQIRLTMNQALRLRQAIKRVTDEAFRDGFAAPREAELIAIAEAKRQKC